jgi:ABC-type uncharacterized transport system YnjBCD permease subunit
MPRRSLYPRFLCNLRFILPKNLLQLSLCWRAHDRRIVGIAQTLYIYILPVFAILFP